MVSRWLQARFSIQSNGKKSSMDPSSSESGEAVPLTNLAGNVVDVAWSQDGKTVACVVDAPYQEEEAKFLTSDVQIITRLRYKADGNRQFLTTRKHIVLYDTINHKYSQITSGDFDFQGICFSADGLKVYYIGSKEENREIEYIPSIWEYDLASKQETLFYKGKGPIHSLKPSPDGKWLGFIGHENGESYSYNANVWIVSTESKEGRNVSKSLDRTVDNVVRVDASHDAAKQQLIWSEDSTSIYFGALDHGSVRLYKTTIEGIVSDALTNVGYTITSFDLLNESEAVCVEASHHSTGNLTLYKLNDPQSKTALTSWNQEVMDGLHLSTPERFEYTSTDGLPIEGWVMYPPTVQKETKIPLVLQIHGGPHSAYGYGFQHEWQFMAAKGYAVLYINPRGSQGYGEDFLRQVVGDWGGKDYEDLMEGLDVTLRSYPSIDADALFVTGASYGGYMTNMITARTTRFKAAITQNAVTNLYSMFGTSDIGFYFNSAQLGGVDMWEDEETVMKFSPIRYAKNVQTPTLVLHNENDYRCPMEQAEQWYMALKRLGIDTKLIRFPDEDHGLSSSGKPSHRLERLAHMMDWFETYRPKKLQKGMDLIDDDCKRPIAKESTDHFTVAR